MRRISILILGLTLSAAMLSAKAKYVFYFIGDGMGINQVLLTDMYRSARGEAALSFTSFPAVTYATTFATNDDVTDSAAAGTALATGSKTGVGMLGVDPDGKVLANIAELSRDAGRSVGVLTNVTVNHATPASFSCHQRNRSNEYEIALDMIASAFQFYGGSGISKDKKNKDGAEVVSAQSLFRQAGYTVCNPQSFRTEGRRADKILMLPGEGRKIGFAIDMDAADPSSTVRLAQQTEAAIEVLKKNRKGFFLMVEGGRLDYALHSHDAAASIAEMNELDEAVKLAVRFYMEKPSETLIVVCADHETGGLVVGPKDRKVLKLLDNQKYSKSALSERLREMVKDDENLSWEQVKSFLEENFGFWDQVIINGHQEQRLRDCYERTIARNNAGSVTDLYSDNATIIKVAADILSEICSIHWVSGHSSGYVPVFAIGEGAELFSGLLDNTDIPKKIKEAAGL